MDSKHANLVIHFESKFSTVLFDVEDINAAGGLYITYVSFLACKVACSTTPHNKEI